MSDQNQLHITIASTQQRWHGGEKQAALLAEGLRGRGHACSILARDDGLFASGMRERGFEVATFPGRGRSLPALLKCRRSVQRLRPDVLLANDGHALTSTGLATLGMFLPLRIAARRVDFPIRSRAKFARFADGIICVSSAVAKVCRESGLDASLLQVVHDGVSPSFAELGNRENGRKSLGLDEREPLLLVVAKLTDHKGHRYLLDAMPTILSVNPRVTLALAGDGELRESLHQQATQLGIESSVRFLGYRDDVPDLLAAADLIVQPSHLEGLCSSLIDAMLAAKPIVASAAGGIPDLLETSEHEDEVAWLVPTKSARSLATAANDALGRPDIARARACAARNRALAQFTDEMMVEKTLEAIVKFAWLRHGERASSEYGFAKPKQPIAFDKVA